MDELVKTKSGIWVAYFENLERLIRSVLENGKQVLLYIMWERFVVARRRHEFYFCGENYILFAAHLSNSVFNTWI